MGAIAAPPPTFALSGPAVSSTQPAVALSNTPGTGTPSGGAPSSAVHGLMLPATNPNKGADSLVALALLMLLSGNHKNHGADALGAMLTTLAVNAYTSVQGVGSNPGLTAPASAAGSTLSIKA